MIGGYIRIDFIGRYQTQPQDELYYTVMENISAKGLPIGLVTSPLLSNSLLNFALTQESFIDDLKKHV